MTAASSLKPPGRAPDSAPAPAASKRFARPGLGVLGAAILAVTMLACFVTLPRSIERYDDQRLDVGVPLSSPTLAEPMGTDHLGRPFVWRVLLGGAISLGIGISAAMLSIVIGVTWGALAGYIGGRTDAVMMRIVDVLYGLPYILLVILFAVMVSGLADRIVYADVAAAQEAATAGKTHTPGLLATFVTDYRTAVDLFALLIAIGSVSWLTLARVIRGQVLSLRSEMFIEAARAAGTGPLRILRVHLLPNLVGPIVVYTTLTVPIAILQESFLSFLGIGVQPPLPSWGNLASEGLGELYKFAQNTVTVSAADWRQAPIDAASTWLGQITRGVRWWLIVWPCALLGLTLLSLNLVGDALRRRLDPKRIRR